VIRVDDRRVCGWDGLVAVPGGSMLVRLVRLDPDQPRTARDPLTITNEIALGGFGARWLEWTGDADRGLTAGGFRLVGDVRAHVADVTLRVDVGAVDGEWSGFAIATPGAVACAPRAAALADLLDEAAARDAASMARVRLPHHHRTRATDALRVLHTLTDPQSGAPAASATTSLPEAPGGDRQFDYRFTWLRDSALAVTTAALLGHVDAAQDYVRFVAGVLDRHGEHLNPLTTTSGDAVPDERTLEWISGWGGSRPVRVGNDAAGQRQLDAVAAVIEAVSVHVQCGGRMDPVTWSVVERMADLLANAPSEPSSGIWEFREPSRLTSEELARWIGLDRAVRLGRWYRPWQRRGNWVAGRDAARVRVECAYDEDTGMLRRSIDDKEVVADAAALMAALAGFFPRRDARARRLVHATVAALEKGPFLLRYLPFDDGFVGTEGAFIPASWWAVGALAAVGEVDDAERRADSMCAQLPPLQPEMWDVDAAAGLGNTPLLWSHMEAARALYLLDAARIARRYGRAVLWVWRLARYVRLRLTRR
jgi:GH15 family glucan-1,4-alpha-glucosidase